MPLVEFESGAAYAGDNRALIAHDNPARLGTVTASSEQADSPALNVQNGNTWQFWQPNATGSQTLTFDLLTAQPVDYLMIAAHNLSAELSGDVVLAYSDDNVSYTTAHTFDDADITDDEPVFVHLVSRSHRYWRLTVPTASTDLKIGAVYLGALLQMQRTLYTDGTPPTLTREEERISNDSEAGQFLGELIQREWYMGTFQWENLEKEWYRANFDPFALASQTRPFGLLWRPDDFTQEIVFARRMGRIAPRNSGPAGFMSVSLEVRAIK